MRLHMQIKKIEYLALNLFLIFITTMYFKLSLYIPIEFIGENISNWVLIILVCVSLGFGTVIQGSCVWNDYCILVYLIIGFGMYLSISYISIRTGFICIVSSLMIIISIICIHYKMINRYSFKKNLKTFKYMCLFVRPVISVGFMFMFIGLCIIENKNMRNESVIESADSELAINTGNVYDSNLLLQQELAKQASTEDARTEVAMDSLCENESDIILTHNVEYIDGKYYVVSIQDGIVAGPYTFIEDTRAGLGIHRFMDENGMIGYLDYYGEVISDTVYKTAGDLNQCLAAVRDSENRAYYIDATGTRISGDYSEAYDFDYFGHFGLVRCTGGNKWGLVNSKGKLLLEADCIDYLYFSNNRVCIVDNGVFQILNYDPINEDFDVEHTIEGNFIEVESVQSSEFILIKDVNGNVGVVGWDGEIIIPIQYKDINYDIIYNSETYSQLVSFTMRDALGNYSVVNKIFEK